MDTKDCIKRGVSGQIIAIIVIIVSIVVGVLLVMIMSKKVAIPGINYIIEKWESIV